MGAADSRQKRKQSFLFSFNKMVERESVQMSALRHEQMKSLIFTAAAHEIIVLIRVRRGSPSPRNIKNAFNFWKLINAKTKNNEVFDVYGGFYLFFK